MITMHRNRYFFKAKGDKVVFVSPTQDGITTRPLQYGLDMETAVKVYKPRKIQADTEVAPWSRKAASSGSKTSKGDKK